MASNWFFFFVQTRFYLRSSTRFNWFRSWSAPGPSMPKNGHPFDRWNFCSNPEVARSPPRCPTTSLVHRRCPPTRLTADCSCWRNSSPRCRCRTASGKPAPRQGEGRSCPRKGLSWPAGPDFRAQLGSGRIILLQPRRSVATRFSLSWHDLKKRKIVSISTPDPNLIFVKIQNRCRVSSSNNEIIPFLL